MSAAPQLTIEIWSDVICPWCWIGLARFRKALAAFPHAEQVAVEHRSFRLMPGMAPRPIREILAAKMGISSDHVPSALRQVEDVAAGEGLAFRLADTLAGDTIDAHRLIQFAKTKGRGREMLERLYAAYLSEEKSVFDQSVLVALACDAGLIAQDVKAVLASNAFQAEVEADEQSMRTIGASGVPLFAVGERFTVSGAQSPAVFARALAQGWSSAGPMPALASDGAVCGTNGCP